MALPLPRPLIEEAEKTKVKPVTIGSYWLRVGEVRLDAGFYEDKVFMANKILNESKYLVKELGKFQVDIFYPTRFKRIFVPASRGVPFLSAKEIFYFRPRSKRFLSRKQTDKCLVKTNWLLISRSGSIGLVALVNDTLREYAITDDTIRIADCSEIYSGYLYAFLSTQIGQVLLKKDKYGATVTHLEPHHVATMPIPLIHQKKRLEIHEEIIRAYKLRDVANERLDRAESLLHKELGIEPFAEEDVRYIGNDPKTRAFNIRVREIGERFDGSFHTPVVKRIVEKLKRGKYKLSRLDDMVERIFIPPRFKRIYVDEEHGIPFLQGSNISQVKPQGMKYISKTLTKNLEKWIIRNDWVLVTCSGTIGRVAIVPSQWDMWAASQHILRINAGNQSHPGYIAAFLALPFGQHQLLSKIYGGVVDEITEQDTEEIAIPQPSIDVQRRIGTLVVQAFEMKEDANYIEAEAIRELEQILQKN